MTSRRVRFTFPQNLITEPVIYRLGIDFEIITNIRRADVREDMGWVISVSYTHLTLPTIYSV